MFRKGPRCTSGPECTRGPSQPLHRTCGTRPQQTESERRYSSGEFHLSHPATPSPKYLLTIRSSKLDSDVHGQVIRSDRTKPQKAMGSTDESEYKKPNASRVCNKYSCHSFQESK